MADGITQAQLDEWRALAEKATEGPWTVKRFDTQHLVRAKALDLFTGNRMAVCELHQWSNGVGPTALDQAVNAAFIAASRAAVPALVAEVERFKVIATEAAGGIG